MDLKQLLATTPETLAQQQYEQREKQMKTAEQLGIPEAWRAALVLVLEKMERGELRHCTGAVFSVPKEMGHDNFNMDYWNTQVAVSDCGSSCCIGGWAEKLGGVNFVDEGFSDEEHPQLEKLFYPTGAERIARSFSGITVEEGARALRNYLEDGAARWEEVLGGADDPEA